MPRDHLLAALTEQEAFSLTIEKIYDAAVDPQAWCTALSYIREYVDGSSVALHYASATPEKFGAAILHSVGFSDDFLKDSTLYERGWAAQIGLLDWKVGDVRHLPEILPREEYLNGLFYQNVIQPHGELDYAGMVALKEASTIVPLTVSTKIDRGELSAENICALRRLAPHICRAVKISLAFEMKSLDATLMENTLNGLQSGVYILGHDGRIVFMNGIAEQQTKRGHALGIVAGRLVPSNANAAALFASHFVEAHESLLLQNSNQISIALPDPRGGLVATMLPLGVGNRKFLATHSNTAGYAVFVQDPAAAMPHPGAGFKELYGLTTGELRVVMAMLEGAGIRGAAGVLGLSDATIKTHLRNIYVKTGASGQVKLMQMVMQSMAPAAAQ